MVKTKITKQASRTNNGSTKAHSDATTIDHDELMTTEELALFLKVSKRTVDGWRMDQTPNTPPYISVGRSIRYSRRAVQQWLQQKSHQN